MSNNQKKKTRVFFDVSSVIEYVSKIDRYSGIQRVLVNIISEVNKIKDEVNAEFYFCFHDGMTRKYVCVNFDDFSVANFADPQTLRSSLKIGSAGRRVRLDAISKYRNDTLKYHFHRTKLDILAILGKKSAFLRYNLTPSKWLQLRFSGKQKASKSPVRADFFSVCRAGDALLNLDSSWLPLHEKTFSKARANGIICYTLVYDLIPILYPETTHGMMPLIFHKWLLKSVGYTSKYLCISRATQKDLEAFLAMLDFRGEVEVLPLVQQGIEPAEVLVPEGPMSAEVNKIAYPWLYEVAEISDDVRSIATVPYVLCAGTIEARKNVWRIAQAWQLLLDRGHTDMPRLVFAGRKGWHIGPFEDFLRGTGNLGGRIQIVEGPSDKELAFLYKNCDFSIMASLYEGWGLPVGEALSYGKTAVVSRNSSLPEVGSDLVEYCDASSIVSIANACERLFTDRLHLEVLEQRISVAHLRNWDEVCVDLLETLKLDYAPGQK
ncbi:glycosyltransferase family 4 protein [Agrobacterium salinitolerans]|uniref:glycosyltransferase family 4 protein n=1 Tax=Agrobacterium salinitolerans TaxID=1183413 RepID=UPI00174ABD44